MTNKNKLNALRQIALHRFDSILLPCPLSICDCRQLLSLAFAWNLKWTHFVVADCRYCDLRQSTTEWNPVKPLIRSSLLLRLSSCELDRQSDGSWFMAVTNYCKNAIQTNIECTQHQHHRRPQDNRDPTKVVNNNNHNSYIIIIIALRLPSLSRTHNRHSHSQKAK